MTIFNVAGGVFSYSLVVNNKNGKVYRPEMFEVSTSSSLASLAASINLGSIIGGEKSADDIDEVIRGASVSWQSCYGVCAGVIRTQGKATIITYGVGTPQFGVSGGKMVYTGVTLSQAEIKKLVK